MIFSKLSPVLVYALDSLHGSAAQNSTGNDTAACAALQQSAAQLANITIYLAEYYEAGRSINQTAEGLGANPTTAVDLPAFCRFGANISTSANTSVRFELWLPPVSSWNGNLMTVGNGGVGGFVRTENMGVPVGKYGYAVASTNTGHDGGSGDGTFLLNGPEAQIDYGYRAVHLTTSYSKEIVNIYYGQNATLSYWNGCSSGGKQGLKGIQMYPEDYDAALVGAPAYDWPFLNLWTQQVNQIVNPPNSTNYIPPSRWTAIHQEVMSQCDALDGVTDGAILEPTKCQLDYSRFLCGGNSTALNATTCLTQGQVTTFQNTLTNLTDPRTGEFLFPAFTVGAEFNFAGSVNGIPYGPAPSYFLYQVLNVTEVVLPINTPNLTINGSTPTLEQLIDLAKTGNETDPGMIRAASTNLTPFFSRGGKLIHYVGGADWLIPTGTSLVYHNNLTAALGNITDSYQYYVIPGMGHCTGGQSAFNFGQASQITTRAGGANQAPMLDPMYDVTLALAAWRENGTRPETLIGTSYVGNNINNGTAYTRKICPYPLVGRYNGTGDVNDQSSYECQL